ncbi:MAG TPA: histone deacetylase family protein [Burkholderiaceae bacterium]|nr:histone deacetylase family protein [Burkholderiaceae bacterium]
MFHAYITHSDCLKHEMGPHHPECPERLSAIQDRLRASGVLDLMRMYDAPLATVEQLSRAHDKTYIERLHASAPREGYVALDPDTMMNAHTWNAALRAAGAVVLATDLVMTRQAATAFCNVRPPGHHAEHASAMGFCFINNVAVGIRHAIHAHSARRVALIDFDVHHGNGSEDIFADDTHVLMCSTFERNLYPYSGDIPRGANMINIPLPAYSHGTEFRAAVQMHWLAALDAFQPEVLFISAGFDAHREDMLAHLKLVEADYQWVTRELVSVAERHALGRIVSVLEGGYALSALGRSAAVHVKELVCAST